MSRLGQYLIEQEELTDVVVEGDGGSIDPAVVATRLDVTPEEVQRAVRLVEGLEEFPAFPVFESPVEELIPSVGEEDFKEKLDRVWETIKRWIRNIIRWLDQTLDAASVSLRVLKFMVEQAQYNSRSVTTLVDRGEGQLVLNKYVEALSVRYAPLPDIGKITGALGILQKHTNAYYDYVNNTLKGGLAPALKALANGRADDPATVAAVLRIAPHQVVRSMTMRPVKGLGNAMSSAQLMGNMRFVLQQPVNDVHRVTQLQGIKLEIQHAEIVPRGVPDEIKIPRFNRVSTDQCLKRLESMIADMESVVQGKTQKNHRQVINDIESMGERFRSGIRFTEGDEDDLRQRLMVTQLLITWVTKPYRGIVTHSMRSMRGALALCNLNLK